MRLSALVNSRKKWCSKLFLIVIAGSLLTFYVTLLRYNKASTTKFNLRSKRRTGRDKSWHAHHPDQTKIRHIHEIPAGFSGRGSNHTHNNSTHVFIVEEHHEVLQYWFEEVEKGSLPKYGNTLVHIDGHIDMAVPTLVNGYPFFRYPRGAKDMAKMTQRNDVFIVEAIIAGLLKRVVWIWPSWDRDSHDDVYTVESLEIGWGEYTQADRREKTRVICLCTVNSTSNEKECVYSSMSALEEEMPSEHCQIKKSIILEQIREDEALNKMTDEKWLLDGESVILDIDEDFYGCTYAISPLLSTKIPKTILTSLDRTLSRLLCPHTGRDETAADKILLTVINVFRNHSRCSNASAEFKTSKRNCVNDERIEIAEKAMINSLKTIEAKLLCSKKDKLNLYLVRKLLGIFSNLKIKQLRSLQNVGFCLTTTRKSYQLLGRSQFQTCHGANSPDDTRVTVHVPTVDEISRRTKLLMKNLQLIKNRSGDPASVTISRSSRDGYTPRYHSNRIERDIMSSLQSTFKRVVIDYDRDLLGGKRGWADRHKVSFT